MLTAILLLLIGLALLVWSAERFVKGSSSAARHFRIPPLLIGMVIVGFGTSAPEMVVSALAALQGNPGIALGNAYGSNIANIALILGFTALITPILVHSTILRKELPLLMIATAVTILLIIDLELTFTDAVLLLLLFAGLMTWTICLGLKRKPDEPDPLAAEMEIEVSSRSMTIGWSIFWVIAGLALLIISSRMIVRGAVEIAGFFGVSDMVIGLTIVAAGTSLPELASAIAAVRSGEHNIALGNVIGSNLFNTLAVVGIAGAIHPMQAEPKTVSRDMVLMGALTVLLMLMGYGFRGRPGRISRFEGAVLILIYAGYITWLLGSII